MTEKFAALKNVGGPQCDGFFGLDHPRCPHCGKACDVDENEWWDLYEEGEHDVECPHCQGAFMVSTRVSYSFSTDEQEGLA